MYAALPHVPLNDHAPKSESEQNTHLFHVKVQKVKPLIIYYSFIKPKMSFCQMQLFMPKIPQNGKSTSASWKWDI